MIVNHCYFDTIYTSDTDGVFNSGYNTKLMIKNCYCKFKKIFQKQ